MPKEINLICRSGNKKNDIKFFKHLLPLDNIINVIEPFGGSFAVINNIYRDDKYNKFVNDTDKDLYNIYTNLDEYHNFCIDMDEICKKFLNENGHVEYRGLMPYIVENKINENKFYKIWEIVHIIRRRMVTIHKTDSFKNINTTFYKKINYSNVDYLDIINRFKYDEKAFIFLDPPYLFSNNKTYQEQQNNTDNTGMILKLLDLFNDRNVKAKIMLIINKMDLLVGLFKNFIKGEYSKVYGISRRCETHLIICNY